MTSVSCHDAGSEPSPARRLVAVLHLDIVGYTRLIALDDLHTLMRMRRIRAEIVTVEATRNGGVLHQSAGDSLLITFDSIAGAVACSLNIQRRVGEAEAGEPEERRITFRAGIDVGDVIADGSDIHGNGVNVAVRLQSACPVGQVCISRAVHDHLHGQLGVPVQPLGRLPLKNIAEPVEAFVLWVDAHLLPAMPIGNPDARPVTSTPSIATLPFRVLSLNVEDRLLVDGLVEEINHSLAGLKELFVISRGSTLRYDPDHADLAEVARELGVGYI
ncbi:MAG: adenylate/guanylate cyclase domain-containing protein, partial [Rhodospirillales bacterium]|nr:adenylate/guanylate cyclase domain-containing protein [Rhodospirillales bacterium]